VANRRDRLAGAALRPHLTHFGLRDERRKRSVVPDSHRLGRNDLGGSENRPWEGVCMTRAHGTSTIAARRREHSCR
jgi:hypothetical protein